MACEAYSAQVDLAAPDRGGSTQVCSRTSRKGTVNLVADGGFWGSLGQDGVAVVFWSGGCGGQSGDLVPGGESGGSRVDTGCSESVPAVAEVG
jgi:hypothetical protein